jgi:hypothetical protein
MLNAQCPMLNAEGHFAGIAQRALMCRADYEPDREV